MKLKKIASLMLAGVMAVSMLTACGDNTVNDPEQPNQPVEPTPAGYSSVLGDALVAQNVVNRKVHMQDSNDLNAALKTAMKFAGEDVVSGIYDGMGANMPRYFNPADGDAIQLVARKLVDVMDSVNDADDVNSWDAIANLYATEGNHDKDLNVTMLYVVNDGVSVNAALEYIAAEISDAVADLDIDYDNIDGMWYDQKAEVEYDYTGSVSADSIKLDANHGKGLTFIAVQITRTVV